MKNLGWLGLGAIVWALVWGMVSCSRISQEAFSLKEKRMFDAGYYQDGWGKWVKIAK